MTATALPIASFARQQPADTATIYLLAGTYTDTGSEGIYVYKFDRHTGALTPVDTASGLSNPSFLVVAPDKKHVYAVGETGDAGKVYALSFDPANGKLQLLNEQPAGGDGPCHINIDSASRNVLVGNYGGGSLSVLPVKEDGSLAAPVQTIQHTGSSIVESRQKAPHVHAVIFSPDGKQLFVPDLGIDKIVVYNYNYENAFQPLTPGTPPAVGIRPGGGPRHFVFHPNGQHAYVVHEISGHITCFHYDTSRLIPFQMVASTPASYKGNKASGADIHISPDGKFLYMSNRGDLNNLAIFRIDARSGKLTPAGHQSTKGKSPRNFLIDPSGAYLLVANQDSDNIIVFKRNKSTGRLTATGQEVSIPKPVCLKMVEAE
ncbi:lactonase family protein [Chitinophaga cymbidii]|nr:lactonase family protein [Chitinophaga cymbidii]